MGSRSDCSEENSQCLCDLHYMIQLKVIINKFITQSWESHNVVLGSSDAALIDNPKTQKCTLLI